MSAALEGLIGKASEQCMMRTAYKILIVAVFAAVLLSLAGSVALPGSPEPVEKIEAKEELDADARESSAREHNFKTALKDLLAKSVDGLDEALEMATFCVQNHCPDEIVEVHLNELDTVENTLYEQCVRLGHEFGIDSGSILSTCFDFRMSAFGDAANEIYFALLEKYFQSAEGTGFLDAMQLSILTGALKYDDELRELRYEDRVYADSAFNDLVESCTDLTVEEADRQSINVSYQLIDSLCFETWEGVFKTYGLR